MNDRLRLVVATCFGLGYSPILPGTCGALVGVANYLAIAYLVPEGIWQTVLIGASFLTWTIVTIGLARWAEGYFHEKDSGIFVTDEVVGFLLTVLLFRISGMPLLTVLWAFPATRIIDILKFPPAKRLEKLPEGWGVVADDILSSCYTAGILYGLSYVFPRLFGAG